LTKNNNIILTSG